MVYVGMGINDCLYRVVTQMFTCQSEGCRCCFVGEQSIEYDPACISLHQSHVGEIEAAHLIQKIGDDLKKTEIHVQRSLSLQGRMHRVVIIATQKKIITGHVPHDISGCAEDLAGIRFGDEPPPGLFEIPLIGKWQSFSEFCLQGAGMAGCSRAFGIEMLLCLHQHRNARNTQ